MKKECPYFLVGNHLLANVNTQDSFKPPINNLGSVLCVDDITLKKVEHILDELPTEIEIPIVIQDANNRGVVRRVYEVIVKFEDGAEEAWNFPLGESAYYREGRNRQTKPDGDWKTHEMWWTSEKED